MTSTAISNAEWRKALGLADIENAIGSGWFTSQELAERLGIDLRAAQRRIRAGWAAGRIKPGHCRRANIMGVMRQVPAYRVVRGQGK